MRKTRANGIQPEGISPEAVVYGEYCANRRRRNLHASL